MTILVISVSNFVDVQDSSRLLLWLSPTLLV